MRLEAYPVGHGWIRVRGRYGPGALIQPRHLPMLMEFARRWPQLQTAIQVAQQATGTRADSLFHAAASRFYGLD